MHGDPLHTLVELHATWLTCKEGTMVVAQLTRSKLKTRLGYVGVNDEGNKFVCDGDEGGEPWKSGSPSS